MSAKRHHYIAEAYLRGFADADGCVTVFRKESPGSSFRASPSNIGLEQYYYAYTKEDDSRDTDSLEQLFSQFESGWPRTVLELAKGNAADEIAENLLSFACLQRARVPALRDAYELMRRDSVGETARFLQRLGKLPDAPPGSEDILDRVEISINPESSIDAIRIAMEGMIERLYPLIGFRVIHNESAIDLITSDNPVAWFIPFKNEDRVKPYEMRPGFPLEFLFPISPSMLLVGKPEWIEDYRRVGLRHGVTRSARLIKHANRMAARFGYRAIFSKDASPASLAAKYSGASPVAHVTSFPHADGQGQLIAVHMEFSPLRAKPKWRD